MQESPDTIYFAGELFDHKHLVGNKLLASLIEQHSKNRYQCLLPQEFECATGRSVDIRDQDLYLVVTCDFALFNFDGHDLDSGTVVEFMIAKMLDIPSVILRTDLRSAGDQQAGDPWNLMCSDYPRSQVIIKNGIAWYQKHCKASDDLHTMLDNLYDELATDVIDALDQVRKVPSVLCQSDMDVKSLYKWATQMAGPSFEKKCKDLNIEQLIESKRKKALLA